QLLGSDSASSEGSSRTRFTLLRRSLRLCLLRERWKEPVAPTVRIRAEELRVGPGGNGGWRTKVLDDQHLSIVGNSDKVVVESVFQVGTAQIVLLTFGLPVCKQRRIQ